MLAVTVLCGLAPSASATNARLAPGGTARYLHAYRDWARTFQSNESASNVSLERFATALKTECTGVLSALSTVADSHALDTQLEAIVEELDEAETDTIFVPDADATRATLNRLALVRFEDNRLTRALSLTYRVLATRASFVPPVCEDMKAWATSGFTHLSAASARLAAERKDIVTTPAGGLLLFVPGVLSRQPEAVVRREANRTAKAVERTLGRIGSNLPSLELLEAVGVAKGPPPSGSHPSS